MNCILAMEPEIGEKTKALLSRMSQFKTWNFVVSSSTEDLKNHSFTRPDVIAISINLPGEKHKTLFENLPMLFPTSRIVIICGKLNSTTKGYIKMAHDCGITNIVTGALPGDRPYNLPTALEYDYENIVHDGEKNLSFIPEVQEVRELPEVQELPEVPETPSIPVWQEPIKPAFTEEKTEQIPMPNRRKISFQQQPSNEYQPPNTSALDQARMNTIEQFMDFASPMKRASISTPTGTLIITSANKGGVGKTSVAVTMAIALSKAGIKVCLTDTDFGGPNIAAFFDVHNVPGIEVLFKRVFTPALIDDLLVPVKDNLFILPGNMDNSNIMVDPEKLLQVHEHLLRKFSVVIVDTPNEFWTDPWLSPLFARSDMVLAVVDQSKFSEHETQTFGPKYLLFGVTPDKIRIVLNRYSKNLHKPKVVEEMFNFSFKERVPKKLLPYVAATIPNDWDAHVNQGYKGDVVGIEENLSIQHLSSDIAQLAGYHYEVAKKEKKAKGLGKLFKGLFKHKKS